ncbi:MAG: hypothetical protein SGI77_06700 [Pirellulaceae bacterium]|nr:hypothetical protein [Pirellulaceae bacterium]
MTQATVAHKLDGFGTRFRLDIEWVYYAEQSKWVARDPLSNAFYYFSQLEHDATRLLDGRKTAEQIIGILRKAFPSSSINLDWLSSFAKRLRNAYLVMPDGNAFADAISKAKATEHVSVFRQLISNPLAIRVPIFNPSSFLGLLKFPAIVLFHPLVVAIGIIASLIGGLLVLNEFLGHPERYLREIATMPVWMWLLAIVAYIFVKVLHELGHVLACVRWKANCREIGLLFLFFTPCMYCDTTDSWKLKSKWQRAAIASGGLYVEMLIASLAAAVWLTTHDGVERMLATSVMLMCSIGTIAINGNPCFRYDGYYILSDIWGVPNLAQQSSSALWQILIAWLGGRAVNPKDFDKDVRILAAYAIVSALYRTFVLVLLLWFVWSLLIPKGLGLFAMLIVMTTSLGFLRLAIRSGDALFTEFFAPVPIALARAILLMFGVLFLVYAAIAFPIPNYVRSRGVLDFHDKIALFAPQNATIVSAASPDSFLQAGELIFELDCPEKKLAMIDLANEIAQVSHRYELLKASSIQESSAAFEIPTLIEILKELQSKQNVLEPELAALRGVAPADGFFVRSATLAPPSLTPPNDSRLSRHVADESNRGCAVERGMLLGWFTSKQKISFQTLIPEAEIKSLRLGMQAECMLDSHTMNSVIGHISRIASDPVAELPPEFSGETWVLAERNQLGKLQPTIPHYQVTVQVDTDSPVSFKGANATLQFKIGTRTIAEHIIRYIRMTFRPVY